MQAYVFWQRRITENALYAAVGQWRKAPGRGRLIKSVIKVAEESIAREEK